MAKIFIDGSAGTTGLRIADRLSDRKDIEIIKLPEELRKDTAARKEALNSADIAFLCLPDQAAVEAVALIDETNNHTCVIDTSTAHRTADGWTYGFPEINGRRDEIKNSKRIANPGCHASGFIALIEPLIREGLLKKDTFLSAFSLTGYSGGGKKMIAQYEDDELPLYFDGPRQYGLTQKHKHLPEMVKITGIETEPAFIPVVGNFYSGMEVTIPVSAKDLNGTKEDIENLYSKCYNNKVVRFVKDRSEEGFLSTTFLSEKDCMEITVQGNDERVILIARYDNLGKGASGSAIQNMNIVLGTCETTGLDVKPDFE